MVIDPNVFISSLMAGPGSPNLTVAQAVVARKLRLVACPLLLRELSDVAQRDRFRRWFTAGEADRLVDALSLVAEMHPDPSTIPPVCADPDDDYLFALAAAANVPTIVSGDGKVQAVDVSGDGKVQAVDMPGTDVISPRAAADRLHELQ